MAKKKQFDSVDELPITTLLVTWEVGDEIHKNKYCIGRFPEELRSEFIEAFKERCDVADKRHWHGVVRIKEIEMRELLAFYNNDMTIVFDDYCDFLVIANIKADFERNYKW